MDFIFEVIIEIILEGGLEISSNKKVSKFIRYPIIFILGLFFILVIGGLFYLGIVIFKKNIFGGIFIIAVSLILLWGCILKFKKIYLRKKIKDRG